MEIIDALEIWLLFSPLLLEIHFTHVSRCSRMLEVLNHMIYFALFVFHFREEFKD